MSLGCQEQGNMFRFFHKAKLTISLSPRSPHFWTQNVVGLIDILPSPGKYSRAHASHLHEQEENLSLWTSLFWCRKTAIEYIDLNFALQACIYLLYIIWIFQIFSEYVECGTERAVLVVWGSAGPSINNEQHAELYGCMFRMHPHSFRGDDIMVWAEPRQSWVRTALGNTAGRPKTALRR
jgi:hypothetical protein